MFVPDVSDFKFVGKVKPAFFIAKEEVPSSSSSSSSADVVVVVILFFLVYGFQSIYGKVVVVCTDFSQPA